jgi:hypothetical protein
VRVLEEVSEQENDTLWSLTAREVAARVDIQSAQQSELAIRDAFIRIASGRTMSRRVGALQALRLMRPEIVLPEMKRIVQIGLREATTDTMAQLLLLMRRMLYYRHWSPDKTVELEFELLQVLHDATAKAPTASEQLDVLRRVNEEWGAGGERPLDLPAVVRKLEKILKTQSRLEHRFLSDLSKYISDSRKDFDIIAAASIDRAVRAGRYAVIFGKLLSETGRCQESSFCPITEKADEDARSLSIKVRAHMHGTRALSTRELRDYLESVQSNFTPISDELEKQFQNLHALVEVEHHRWLEREAPSLGCETIDVEVDTSAVTTIIDRSLIGEIVRNLFLNLRHAIDPVSRTIRARVEVVEKTNEVALLRLRCSTSDPKVKPDEAMANSTMVSLYNDARPYGAERRIINRQPWAEEWTFWRL